MKPDFSGEWSLNREVSVLSAAAASFQGAVWSIDHREPVFHQKASFETGGDPIQYEFELRSDGKEVSTTTDDATTISKLAWDKHALIVSFVTRRANSSMRVAFRYELLDGGRRLRAREQLRGTDHDQDNIWIFDRQGQSATLE